MNPLPQQAEPQQANPTHRETQPGTAADRSPSDTSSEAALYAAIRALPRAHRDAVFARARQLVEVLDLPCASGSEPSAVAALLGGGHDAHIWLTFAVMTARLPDAPAVLRLGRSVRAAGEFHALRQLLLDTPAAGGWPPVEIVREQVLVDLTHTSAVSFATGIQRVARESARRWQHHDPLYVGWVTGRPALRRLSADQRQRALFGGPARAGDEDADETVLVPWGCTYVLAELQLELGRVRELLALARFSGNRTGVIGYDCVPLTSAETVAAHSVSNGFAAHLAAMAHVDRIGAISGAAAQEYHGWAAMLAGTGIGGPQIEVVALPGQPQVPSAEALAQARRQFILAGLPMVLVVGSHEPRKNHLAILHAAELLWRGAQRFSLVFIGGNSWKSEQFSERVAELQRAGRPVQSVDAVTDDVLWATYKLAYCSLFPSLNEGFGLPVAESLASGTPVITSNFGSMREIAEAGGGALLVDPRDDHDIAAGLRWLLNDRDLYERLAGEAALRPGRTWDDYARQLWDYLVPENADTARYAVDGDAR